MKFSKYPAAFALVASLLAAGCSSEPTESPVAAPEAPSAGQSEKTVAISRVKINQEPVVALTTNFGDIHIKLDRKNAPITVDNFLDYVHSGHYDGTVFHQIVKGYIVLGGGFTVQLDENSTAQLDEKPARTPIRNEAHQSRKNLRGTVAMARHLDTIDSATCQFFINLNDNAMLDHQGRDVKNYGYCVFGEIVEGWDVVEQIAAVEVEDTQDFELKPTRTVVIKSARLLR